ncbi:iron-containing alcohol dehydrogenase family protein [Paenibacillus sp. GCM10012307]|uniref:Iron-containing alcohol dehydrogenase family protein n=1 Tax=Paenibacillus roseus TaxID=2798579 RepID=A0A934MN20_9BACL|nr:iron-containing alcohol dehydrogenase family protein [Paenibacillus roseus]MBJ6360536.1 iron-containing alcohol dehydrogenase family protein [Paenibacillus roseus]
MAQIKTPVIYENSPGILAAGGAKIAEYGSRIFIIGGQKALDAARPLIEGLKLLDAAYEIHTYGGYCTKERIIHYASVARQSKADVIVGVGGGTVLDLSKAVAEDLQLPVIAVPTIAATCAAWSALSVLYDEHGRADGYRPLQNSPVHVLADTNVLAAAPRRYLAAGIADTYVKWDEYGANITDDENDFDVRLGQHTAGFARDVLDRYALDAFAHAGDGEPSRAFKEVSDAILWLAGQVGSIRGDKRLFALAHTLHGSLTFFPETRGTLHGEKIAFTLLVHTILEGLPQADTVELAERFHRLELPVTLEQLGLTGDVAELAEQIAERVPPNSLPGADAAFAVNAGSIPQAIVAADQIGKQTRLTLSVKGGK